MDTTISNLFKLQSRGRIWETHSGDNSKTRSDVYAIILLAFSLTTFLFLLEGNIGLNLADEGSLWYGTIHTALGEVPLRDFQSYDPGRYYWTAFWSIFLGHGIMALRISVAIFGAIGLSLGLLAARRVIDSFWSLSLVGLLLIVWMFPRHKLFDVSISMSAVFFAVRLLEKPSLLRHFSAGLFVGVAAFLGRNHGLYCLLAFALLLIFIRIKINHTSLLKQFLALGSGIAMGYSPMFIMFIYAPGFYDSFISSLLSLYRQKATNIPLRIPWPWCHDYAAAGLIEMLSKLTTGCLFVLMPVCYIFSIIMMLSIPSEAIRSSALFVGSTFVGIFYMHYAFARADLGHLAHSIQPFLLLMISLPLTLRFKHSKIVMFCILTFLTVSTVFSVGASSPYDYNRFAAPNNHYISYNLLNDKIRIDKGLADLLDNVKTMTEQRVRSDEELAIIPHWPGMYCFLQRKSPLKEIYFLLPDAEERQREMIKTLDAKNVKWVILGDIALDGRDDLRFRNTHNLVWKHLMSEFEPVSVVGLPNNYQLLHKSQNDLNKQVGD